MSANSCILCQRTVLGDNVAVIRCNIKGEDGLFACTECRPKFARGYKPTTEVVERLMQLRH